MTIGSLAAGLFLLTTGGVVLATIAAVRRLGPGPAGRGLPALIVTASLLAWLGLTYLLAASGAFSDFSAVPPHITPVVVAGNLAAVVVACSALGRRLALETPVAWLV